MTEEMVAYGTYEAGPGRLNQCSGMSLERYGRAGEPGAGAEHLSCRLKLMTPDGYRERL
jgi:hypothetical protein